LRQRTAGGFGDDELPGKGEEHSQTEYLERMLAAADCRLQQRRIKTGPVRRNKAHGDYCQRQEMGEAQDIEVGLVDRIHPFGEPARDETIERFNVPG
jgi:hypothetical protein